jgi:phenylpropionate dioxygenase-like ring-hydroxylating dioxygenase large terminal subunit
VGITLANQDIVVFRTAARQIGAMADACPHRRLKLSVGTVIGEKLQCQYHGWTFNTSGEGESPGSPKLTACNVAFTVREAHGLIWLATRTCNARFPEINAPGFVHICTLEHTIPAPLELAIDNFNEIEHSGTVHKTFGYDINRLAEVEVKCDSTDDYVHVINVGPTKRLNKWNAYWMGIKENDLFHDDWTTRFSPLSGVFDHWWTAPDRTTERLVRWRGFLFFTPVNDRTTKVFSITYAKSRYSLPGGGLPLVRWKLRAEAKREIQADAEILKHMSSYDTGMQGMKLGRFDKPLGLIRERINRVYRARTV